MNESIVHGIYAERLTDKIVTRQSFFRKRLDLKYFWIENELQNTLKRKAKSWKNKVKYIEFTYGYNDKYAVLTIVSPKDHFNHIIGYTITKGRLEKADKILERDYGLIDGFIQVVKREVPKQ